MIGHIVITLPYTILVLMPRLQQIDVSLEEAAFDLGAGRLRTFRSITLPLILPAVVSAFLIAFTTSFDEYAVASFVVGSRTTFPIYLYSALRFPSQLPQVIAVAVVVIAVSLAVVVAAEVGRRVFERRVGAVEPFGPIEQRRVLRVPGDAIRAPCSSGRCASSASRWRRAARPACRRGTACTCPGRRSRRAFRSAASRRSVPSPPGAPMWIARGGPRSGASRR